MLEFIDRLLGNQDRQRLSLEQLARMQGQQQGLQAPQQQPQAQPLTLDQLAQPKEEQGGLTLESLGNFAKRAFLPGLGMEETARERGRLEGELMRMQSQQANEAAQRDFAQKLYLQQQRGLGQTSAPRPFTENYTADDGTLRRGMFDVQGNLIKDFGPVQEKQSKPRTTLTTIDGRRVLFDLDTAQVVKDLGTDDSTEFKQDKEAFDKAIDLGNRWYAESKEYFGAKQAYNNVLAAAEDPSPAGDIALIFAFMKTLDPTSTVREGEFATAENAGSVSESIRNKYNRVIAGERLGATRQDFVNQARKAFERKLKQQEIVNNRWRRKAKAFRVDPALVVDDAEMAMPEPATMPGGGQPQDGNVIPGDEVKVLRP